MHQYQLQKYSGIKSRHRCPQCNHRNKTFTLYINTDTNEPLNDIVGKCDRQDKCGYHYTPRMWFADNKSIVNRPWTMVKKRRVNNHGLSTMDHGLWTMVEKNRVNNHGLWTMDHGLFKRTLKHYHRNHLITYLAATLGADAVQGLINRYQIGTAKHWPGATVFWQIDINGNIRAGKVMLYNPASGKRVKQPFNHIAWAHKLVVNGTCEMENGRGEAKENDTSSIIPPTSYINQCLFGEHLLAGNNLPVAIVESEKTAMIASVYMPWYVWLATGGLSNLSAQKLAVLHGRDVYLYPDVNAFDAWLAKAKTLKLTRITVTNMLELAADDQQRNEGFDIADYLLGC